MKNEQDHEIQASDVWRPSSKTIQLNHEPMDATMDFFTAPPAQLGEIIAASSSLKVGRTGFPLAARVAIAAVCILVSALYFNWQIVDCGGAGIIGGFLGAIPGMLLFAATRFNHFVGYVSKNGYAKFTCKDHRDNIVKAELMLFDDVADLYASEVRESHNFIYSGTGYEYKWCTEDRTMVSQITGMFYSNPKPDNPYFLATAAETAWTSHLASTAMKEFKTKGHVTHNLQLGGSLRLGKDWIEFPIKEQVVRLTTAEVKQIEIANGMILIEPLPPHKKIKTDLLDLTPSYDLAMSNIANVKILMLCLSKLTTFPIQSC